MKVADFVDVNGCWKWSELNKMFCAEVKECIAACHQPNDAFGEDVCLWQAIDNLCGDVQDTGLHVLRDCRSAAEVRGYFG
ncbi:hypothetical protein PVK06_046694 [Gossypium arboreum]|nr:hypothetical protein PVK06_046694 [Gossypium arboreum]